MRKQNIQNIKTEKDGIKLLRKKVDNWIAKAWMNKELKLKQR